MTEKYEGDGMLRSRKYAKYSKNAFLLNAMTLRDFQDCLIRAFAHSCTNSKKLQIETDLGDIGKISFGDLESASKNFDYDPIAFTQRIGIEVGCFLKIHNHSTVFVCNGDENCEMSYWDYLRIIKKYIYLNHRKIVHWIAEKLGIMSGSSLNRSRVYTNSKTDIPGIIGRKFLIGVSLRDAIDCAIRGMILSNYDLTMESGDVNIFMREALSGENAKQDCVALWRFVEDCDIGFADPEKMINSIIGELNKIISETHYKGVRYKSNS